MPTDFDEDIKHWRDISPPDTLKPRIAAALAPRPSFRLKPAFAAFAAAAAVAAFVALLPGSPVRPSPVFADIRQAMSTVKNIAWTEREQRYDLTGKLTFDSSARHWLRRSPAAIATLSEGSKVGQQPDGEYAGPRRELFDSRGYINGHIRENVYYVHPELRVISRSGETKDIDWMVEKQFAQLTGETTPENEQNFVGPLQSDNVQTSFTKTALDGKSALMFTRVAPVPPGGVPLSVGPKGVVATLTLWADPTTKRVIQRQLRFMSKNGDTQPFQEIVQTSTNFAYDQTPPAGTFDWSPPPGAKVE